MTEPAEQLEAPVDDATAGRLVGQATLESVLKTLAQVYDEAGVAVESEFLEQVVEEAGDIGELARQIGGVKHAVRGAALTLLTYKIDHPEQDIRRFKSEQEGGFSARTVDTVVTVPFLLDRSLPRNVESHWLSQTLSFGEPYTRSVKLKTVPVAAGPAFVELVNTLEELPREQQADAARLCAVILMARLIEVRNKSQVVLTRPKNLTVDEVVALVAEHFARKYRTGRPRLPQLAIHAAFACVVATGANRYENAHLSPLLRMKAADRKARTVGDVVVMAAGRPYEAVEVKTEPVNLVMVLEAMEKIRGLSVERYYVLSTSGIVEADRVEIESRCRAFRDANGCEVIVDDVLRALRGMLRLLRSTTAFIDSFASALEIDEDLDYEHRVAWNQICAEHSQRGVKGSVDIAWPRAAVVVESDGPGPIVAAREEAISTP